MSFSQFSHSEALYGRYTHEEFHVLFQGQAVSQILLRASEAQRHRSLCGYLSIHLDLRTRKKLHPVR